MGGHWADKGKMERKRFNVQRVSGMSVSDEELLADLRSVAANLGKATVGQKEYRRLGRYDDTTASRRFGTWNNALRAAGLELSNELGLTEERLFENILALWSHYGRQPRRRELAMPPSTVSQSPYLRKFGSSRAAAWPRLCSLPTSGRIRNRQSKLGCRLPSTDRLSQPQ